MFPIPIDCWNLLFGDEAPTYDELETEIEHAALVFWEYLS